MIYLDDGTGDDGLKVCLFGDDLSSIRASQIYKFVTKKVFEVATFTVVDNLVVLDE